MSTGGPRRHRDRRPEASSEPRPAPSCPRCDAARAWARASARTLARRLRRERVEAAAQAASRRGKYDVELGERLVALAVGLDLHRELDRLNACHSHFLGAALHRASGLLGPGTVRQLRRDKKQADLARHAPFRSLAAGAAATAAPAPATAEGEDTQAHGRVDEQLVQTETAATAAAAGTEGHSPITPGGRTARSRSGTPPLRSRGVAAETAAVSPAGRCGAVEVRELFEVYIGEIVAAATCPAGHGMVITTQRCDEYECDTCEEDIIGEAKFLYCGGCDVAKCGICLWPALFDSFPSHLGRSVLEITDAVTVLAACVSSDEGAAVLKKVCRACPGVCSR